MLPYQDGFLKENKIITPMELFEELPTANSEMSSVEKHRNKIRNVLNGKDNRLLVVVGPCSIHDIKSALEYAERLSALRKKSKSNLEIIMRVYFEKPRTTIGWKGLINDPDMNNSFDINNGLFLARNLLLDINKMDLPVASEFLDMITPKYLVDLISWGAIGARTTESQIHRELASSLSCPVGFKNSTDGSIKIAIDAIHAANSPHSFISITKFGYPAMVSTNGNRDCHIILRGGKEPNYSSKHVNMAKKELEMANLNPYIMIDFSHANSEKKFKKQLEVGKNVCEQISSGYKSIIGVMIESHLVEGSQNICKGKALIYGKSVTDSCIGWNDTEMLLYQLSQAVEFRRLSEQSYEL
ncbi:3-deoxy-7-phosphoheptulonate synthase AroG [Xenorhabdus sp. SGI240]|uniref:3-deoxy-7-phosphoheptulonate synthase AroG n=1 Tax=Xenorhabdus sp. SGI240 TaxID=3158262 RepID=UPI0032B839A4